MLFEIKHRFTGAVLFSLECGSLKICVEAAVKSRANLSGANLNYANLSGANLSGANLNYANLSRANLRGANLNYANLRGANLRDAYLRGANLSGANLRGAYLSGADLRGANLRDAYLSGANLNYANLNYANLRGANLRDAYLRGAYLSGANLSGADLSGADLSDADLSDADLSDADLSDADLSDANLSGAYLGDVITEPASEEEIARLDAVREIVLAKPKRLDMNVWHSDSWNPDHTPEEEHECKSAHCIAGWLQALSADKELRKLDALSAGRQLAPASSYMFFTSDAIALEWLKERGYAKKAQAA